MFPETEGGDPMTTALSPEIVILIPAYQPDHTLITLVSKLTETGFRQIVVVDDGSTLPESKNVFSILSGSEKVTVLRHPENRGKGAALKTGLAWCMNESEGCRTVITVDADGQHVPEDILALACESGEHPEALILGVRNFSGPVPFRSRLGNSLTRFLMNCFLGISLRDTQTGLRAIPLGMIPELLALRYNRYEFELEMLFRAKRMGMEFRQIPVRTVYLAGNESSHFSPLRDSFKIYFVLCRYLAASVITAIFDYAVFVLVFSLIGNVAGSTAVSRGAAVCLNYFLVRNMVFSSHSSIWRTLPKYLLLVFLSGSLSVLCVTGLEHFLRLDPRFGKLLAEIFLYLVNFLIQKKWIFPVRGENAVPPEKTDWTRYYSSPVKTASYARWIVSGELMRVLERIGVRSGASFAELGGGGSVFLREILRRFSPSGYVIYDNCPAGIEKVRQWNLPGVRAEWNDLLQDRPGDEPAEWFDCVFSVGLIEHFSPSGTKKIVERHFEYARPGGFVVLFFPTPTRLYRMTRCLSEILHLWIFFDERPLHLNEVEEYVCPYGEIVFRKLIWMNFLTQQILIIRKKEVFTPR